MEFFSDSPVDDLVAEFPEWLRADDPNAELNTWLGAIGGLHEELDAAAEQLYFDTSRASAGIPGLLAEQAYVYGIRNELASGAFTTDQVRAYVEAWIACNGSAKALQNLLFAIINLDPRNANYGPIATFSASGPVATFDAGGAGLTFPGGGGGIILTDGTGTGLTFPVDGSGITLYQITVPPTQIGGLIFPLDGGGFTFPPAASTFPGDGSGIALPANFEGFAPLTFPNGSAWVTVTEDFAHYGLTVTIRSWLAYNRGAVLRALDRFRQAHCTPTVYIETPT